MEDSMDSIYGWMKQIDLEFNRLFLRMGRDRFER